jgi:general secretion pathway protein E
LSSGILDRPELARAEAIAKVQRERIDRVLNQIGLVSDDALCAAWSEVTNLPVVAEADYPQRPVLAEQLGAGFLLHAGAVPLSSDSDGVDLAIADPLDAFTPAAIAAKTGLRTRLKIGRSQDLRRALDRLYVVKDAASEIGPETVHDSLTSDLDRLRDLASDAPVIKLVQGVLERGISSRASDIHITVNRKGARVRLRTDGVLKEWPDSIPLGLYDGVVSRIKILGGLDIAERRLPQDGSARVVANGCEVDLRIATMPHLSGEGVVVRILDRSALSRDLTDLGVSAGFIDDLKAALAKPSGIVLMTGPTGSGKTTTLYAALRAIGRSDRNIITIEDPVEYQLPSVTQIQVDAKIGFTFAAALRAALRQDPDVILIGEIRDVETAEIAVRAALTGHLVLASIHTNSSAAALPRLTDMGIEPYLLASTVRAVMAQRLVRTNCPHCAQRSALDLDRLRLLGMDAPQGPILSTRGSGCPSCEGTGYKGRTAVTEFMGVSRDLEKLIAEGATARQLEVRAQQDGMRTLAQSGLDLLCSGRTTLDELERVIGGG